MSRKNCININYLLPNVSEEKKKDKHLIQFISRMLLLFSLLPSETQLLMFSLLIYAFILRKDLISFLYFWAASLVKLYQMVSFERVSLCRRCSERNYWQNTGIITPLRYTGYLDDEQSRKYIIHSSSEWWVSHLSIDRSNLFCTLFWLLCILFYLFYL